MHPRITAFISLVAACVVSSRAWAYPEAFCGRSNELESCPEFAQSWLALALIAASAAFVAVEVTRRVRLAALPILVLVAVTWRFAIVARVNSSWPFEPSEQVAIVAVLLLLAAAASSVVHAWWRRRNFARLDRCVTGEVTTDDTLHVVRTPQGTAVRLDRRRTRTLGFARSEPPWGPCTVSLPGLPRSGVPFRSDGSAPALVRGAWLLEGDGARAAGLLIDASNRALRLAVAAATFSLHVAWIVWIGSMQS